MSNDRARDKGFRYLMASESERARMDEEASFRVGNWPPPQAPVGREQPGRGAPDAGLHQAPTPPPTTGGPSRGVVAAAIIAFVLVGGGIAAAIGGSDRSSPSAPSAPPVRLLASGSRCEEDAVLAQVIVVAYLQNPADREQSTDVQITRRYTDGSENGGDAMYDLQVPPHAKKVFFTRLDYRANAHDLILCRLSVGGQETTLLAGG